MHFGCQLLNEIQFDFGIAGRVFFQNKTSPIENRRQKNKALLEFKVKETEDK